MTKRPAATLKKQGRPSKFTSALAGAICRRLAEGESLRAICRDKGMPSVATVRAWVLARDGFAEQCARARDLGLDMLADEVLDIADNPAGDVAAARLRFDARRWYLSKLAPRRYGDAQRLTHASDVDAPIKHMVVTFVKPGDGGAT